MTKADMLNLQAAESLRDRRRKAIMRGEPDNVIAGYLLAESQALIDAVETIRRRLGGGK